MNPVRIAVLFSGGGTDFQAVIDGTRSGKINGSIVVAICSNHKAFGRERAKNNGIPLFELSKSDFGSAKARDEEILNVLRRYDVELVVLAGYLGILSPELITAFPRRIINIHPALLPLHGGAGMYGLNVHKEVIACGDKKSGATVHYVDSGTDTGEIIAQRALDVLPTDTPETLQSRILNEIEHPLLQDVIAKLCEDFRGA